MKIRNGEKMLKKLKQNDFSIIYQLMQDSFPYDEIRSFQEQEKLLSHTNYKILTLSKNNEIFGFVAIWEFENFVFVEHFAISTNQRNKGLGHTILKELRNYTTKKIILEVEHPNNDISKRRIDFYQRNGFKLFDFNYVMPAYSKNHEPIPLLIMSTYNLNQIDYNDFFDKICNVVIV